MDFGSAEKLSRRCPSWLLIPGYRGPVPDDVDSLERQVPIDPLLNEPLELSGSKARGRTLADALLRQLGFESRLEEGRISDSTRRLALKMLPRLIDTRERPRCSIPRRAEAVAEDTRTREAGQGDSPVAVQAMLDLGWGHEMLPASTLRDVVSDVVPLRFEEHMTARVLQLLRRWERKGWIADTSL